MINKTERLKSDAPYTEKVYEILSHNTILTHINRTNRDNLNYFSNIYKVFFLDFQNCYYPQ